jgi:hypothetical protein
MTTDFFGSPHAAIGQSIRLENSLVMKILIRTQPGETRQVLDGLAALWKQMNPQFPFTYQFSDEEYDKLYREIGIRKVLGASVASVFRLLSGEFVVLVCLSLLAGAAALVITFLTIGFQTMRAALTNPVSSLRAE